MPRVPKGSKFEHLFPPREHDEDVEVAKDELFGLCSGRNLNRSKERHKIVTCVSEFVRAPGHLEPNDPDRWLDYLMKTTDSLGNSTTPRKVLGVLKSAGINISPACRVLEIREQYVQPVTPVNHQLPNREDSVPALAPKARAILLVLFKHGAHPNNPLNREQIADTLPQGEFGEVVPTSENIRESLYTLRSEELIESKGGRHGGFWITDEGKNVARQIAES